MRKRIITIVFLSLLLLASVSTYAWYVNVKLSRLEFDIEKNDYFELVDIYVLNDSDYDGYADPIFDDLGHIVNPESLPQNIYNEKYYSKINKNQVYEKNVNGSIISYKILLKKLDDAKDGKCDINFHFDFDVNNNDGLLIYRVKDYKINKFTMSEYEQVFNNNEAYIDIKSKSMYDFRSSKMVLPSNIEDANDYDYIEILFRIECSASDDGLNLAFKSTTDGLIEKLSDEYELKDDLEEFISGVSIDMDLDDIDDFNSSNALDQMIIDELKMITASYISSYDKLHSESDESINIMFKFKGLYVDVISD